MDGIGGCSGLHKLWLCSNQLRRLEGLGNLPDLRELWLQENLIEDVGGGGAEGSAAATAAGLGGCINLQVLALAGNPLCECEALALDTLSALPALHDLS
eukprot:COSAG04_NODE_26311_length_296_cov_1.035533_1_plen_98_part_11